MDRFTMEFLQVLQRFFAIQGQPGIMTSDNGSEFTGANKELRLMVRGLNIIYINIISMSMRHKSKTVSTKYEKGIVMHFTISRPLCDKAS